VNRREFLAAWAAAGVFASKGHAHSPFPFKFRQQPPWTPLLAFTEAGSDEFPAEKLALAIEIGLRASLEDGRPRIASNCAGSSPAPERYRDIAPGVAVAVFGSEADVPAGWRKWRDSLGTVRYARFYSLPGDIVRYDIRSENKGRLEHRIGIWKCKWSEGVLTHLDPQEETLTYGAKAWFRDITSHVFEGEASFADQMMRGVPYWRARLDPACGIDVYGENGIAAADIDGDGQDEIYVCQPGGLPNRLYKIDPEGRIRDISRAAGIDILDDTAAALFVDLRNSGSQDLVLVRGGMPMLFLNDGKGRFRLVPDAFRFATRPQGSFTSVAAADYDRDGRLDLYFCCYVYYQSEAQYRYPVPYHDARNGPPNFLFRNRLDENPGFFEDVTAASGIDQNNTQFSFAANWCDYNGDGWPDLYVTNDFGRKNLYRNDHGKFRDVADEAGVVDLGPGMSAAWFDYDGDGWPDLLVSNMWSSCGQRIVNDPAFGPVAKDPSLKEPYRKHVKGNSLYQNNGDGTFTYTGNKQGIEICPWSWSCDAADFDNDGRPEIYVACGMVSNNSRTDLMSYFYRQVVSKSPPKYGAAPEYENGWNAINQLIRQDYSWAGPEPNVFFAQRNGRYYDFSGVSGIDKAEDSRAFAITDIDGDGNLDLVLKSRMGPQVRVFQNACAESRKAVVIALRGTKSNRDAIGARVELDGQVKWVFAGSAYLSQHTKRLHFGLGDRNTAAKLKIQWPSGTVSEFGPLQSGFLYEAVEGSSQLRRMPLKSGAESPAQPERLPHKTTGDNKARLHTTWFWEPVPLPDRRRGPALLFIHAGEPAPRLAAPVEQLDLRKVPEQIAAAYAIFRRYLFDYRVDLETPIFLLIDNESRARKIYESAPDDATVQADVRSLGGPLPDVRGLPFAGVFLGQPRRDYYKIGGALLMAGYGEQALPYLEEMVRLNPENSKALFAIGRVHLQAKRLEQARSVLGRAAALNPGLPEVWNELGGVETEAGNYRDALRLYEKALALRPDSGYALLNVAQTQSKLGNAAEAERAYRQVLATEPQNADAANGLGLLLARQARNDEARKLFEQAISARRDDSSAINNLGVLYVNMGQTGDAIAAFQYGIQVAPDDDTLYLNLARVWVARGDKDRARAVMQQLLDRKPGNAIALKALKALDTP
jgi:tetratricopeptide (TPR) repeat protein